MQKALIVGFLGMVLSIVGCTPERYASHDRGRASKVDTTEVMKKGDVISMAKAGVSDSLIITMIESSDSWFQLKPQDVVELKNAGVSDKVVGAMIMSNDAQSDGKNTDEVYYTPRYWYGGYYPYWYGPSLYFSYNYHRPVYIHRTAISRRSFFGGYHSSGGARGGGRRR